MRVCWGGEVDHARGGVDLKDGILANEDIDVGVIGGLLPVVPFVELGEEEGGFFVVVCVPEAAGRDVDCVVEVFVVGGGYEAEVGLDPFDAVIEDGEAVWICTVFKSAWVT